MRKIAPPYGFTLLEIIVVIIIIGVIAGIAYPRFAITLEKFQMEEGKNILRNLAAAQKRYKIDSGAANYLTGTDLAADLAKLDIDLRNTAKFTITSICPMKSALGECTALGRVNRVNGGTTLYSLVILVDMNFACSPVAYPTICSKLGF